MKSKSYWQKRFEQLENARHSQSQELVKELEKDIKLAQKELEKEINNWYARIAVNNDISIREAKKLLKANELEEFKWTVEEYIKKGKENGINEQWMKELENASAKFHISRLEQIKLQTRQIIEQLYDDRLDKIDSHIERMYTDGYYKSLYELQKGIGVAFNVTAIDTRKLSMIMSKPWAADGRNFSDRIWTSKAQLINEVHTNLTRMCMLGEAPDKAINNIAKAMNVSKNQAARLVMTESAYFATESQKKAYSELDVEEYEILATLDYKTSDICRTMDGKHFKLSDMHIGVNAPPFHCYCRTVTIPYYDDEFIKNEKRWSRKNNGETELVDGNLTYKEWEKKYVQVGEQESIKTFTPSKNNDKIISGGRILDPNSEEAIKWAEKYYEQIRKKSTDYIKIAERLNMDVAEVKEIKDYLFVNKSKYDDISKEWTRFDADAAIAQSWQRLAENKKIMPHDLTLIKHEKLEIETKKNNPNMSHNDAHKIAELKYNYKDEVDKYYGNLSKSKKSK